MHLTAEQQLRLVADAWLSAHASHRVVWEPGEDDALLLLFGYVGPEGEAHQRPRLFLTLSLRSAAPLVVLAVTAWTHAGCSVPLEVRTVEDVAAWLDLDGCLEACEPF